MLGEALVDLFVPRAGDTLVDARHFVPMVGGAPANVAVQVARLGVDVDLWSAVGKDAFGARLSHALEEEGVDVDHVARVAGKKTGLTFVEVDRAGERTFTPRREESAVDTLSTTSLPLAALDARTILHHGTVLLRASVSRRTTRDVVRAARNAGSIVSLDVNLRPALFSSREEMLTRARRALPFAHVVKATREEADAVLGGERLRHRAGDRARDARLADLLLEAGAHLVLLTRDREGALLASHTARVDVAAPRVRVVDATGAGDAFLGAALASLIDGGVGVGDLASLEADALRTLGARACAAGAAAVTALGATTGMLDARALGRAVASPRAPRRRRATVRTA